MHTHTHTHVFNWTVESLPLSSPPLIAFPPRHFAHLISSQAGQHHMNISRCHGDGARNVSDFQADQVIGCSDAHTSAAEQFVNWCTGVKLFAKKATQNGSKLAACVRLSYFVSKVLKFDGLKPGRNLYGFWVDPWFRASKNTSKLLNTGLAAGKSISCRKLCWRAEGWELFFKNPVRTGISSRIPGQQS